MVIIKVLLIWSVLAFSKIADRFGVKNVALAGALILLILFGDTLLPALFHVLHILWEMIESVCEHFLESMFRLTPRQAELIVAWIGILTMIAVGVKLIYQAYRYSIVLFSKCRSYARQLNAELQASPLKLGLLLSMLSLTTYGATFLMF